MTSVRARLGASLSVAAALTLVPLAAVPAHAAPAVATVTASTVSASTAVPSYDRSTPVSRAGRVSLSAAALRNPVTRGRAIVKVAATLRGIRYVAGGTSPRSGFDCSGYTRYVFSRLGISLPRVSRAQYASLKKISRAQAVPGDLVYFYGKGGRVYHAAIYAGGNAIWHSPYPGQRVKLERIWSSRVHFARVAL